MRSMFMGKGARPAALSVGLAACMGGVTGAAMHSTRVAASAEAAKRSYRGGERGKPQLLIGNPDAFAKKWKKFSADGLDKLLVISDFDQTLTPYFKPNGDQGNSSHGALMSSSVLDPKVAVSERELFLKYFPIEMSPTLSQGEKLPYMIEWWTKAHDLLIEYKLTKQQIVDAVAQSDLTFRAGFHELFGLLTRANVPVLIFSAGLYDVIHAVLEKEYKALSNEESTAAPATPSNLHVVSNMMHFDEATGAITGFDGKLIHSFNKNASVVLDTPFWKQCQLEQRRNILLLGDSRSDFKMANGLDFHDDEILRVGFLNTHVDDALDEYLTAYDVVLTHDASLLPIEALMQQLERAAK